MSRARPAGPIAVVLISLLLLVLGGAAVAADPGSMDAMSIDMDIAGNTATSLGPRDECFVASPGAILTLDVTAIGVPATNPMVAFAYMLNFPDGVLTVESADPNFLLADLPGSTLFDLSDPVPDGDGLWYAGVADFSDSHESGSGVLDRMTLSVAPGAAPGLYSLALSQAEHGDMDNNYHPPAAVNHAFIAVSTTCENLPSPTPVPTPTPTPPPPPAFTLLAGDVDCSGTVSAVDGLKVLRFEAGLSVSQVEPCPDPGVGSLGDVDCNSYTNPRDALSIFRWVAGLTQLPSAPGCPPIRTVTDGAPYPVPDGGTPMPGPDSYVVSVTSAEVEAGGQATVDLHLAAPQPGAGAYSIDVVFDPSLVAATGCSVIQPPGVCNTEFAPDRVRIAGATVLGLTEVDLASITFQARNDPGVSSLIPQTSLMFDTDGNPRTTTAIPGSLTIELTARTPTPTATPTPGPVTPAPSPVPGEPPPFDPGGVVCFEYLESVAECDGDSAPGVATDIRTKLCIGWNEDCSVMDMPVLDSNSGGLVFFTPLEWYLPVGDTIPVGALAGRLESRATLGLLNNPCDVRIQIGFTLLNASIDTGNSISPAVAGDPMAPLALDTDGNAVPDGADKYPAFLNSFIQGAQPRERLFGITHVQGSWLGVNVVFFEPGATLTVGGNTITFDPALGYPAIFVLQDPTAQAAPSVISDFCAPFFAQIVVPGKTLNNPCTPTRVIGANCPVTSNIPPEFRELGYPSFPCDPRSRHDDDGDGRVNDGCPQWGPDAESGAQCENDVTDDTDGAVNDGCPQFGDVSEGTRIPGSCSAGDEGGCTYRANPAAAGTVTFTTLDLSQRDADGDGIENSLDACALVSNSGWNPRQQDPVNDPDNDGLPSVCDPNPNSMGASSPGGCSSGYTGADEDQDCFSNRADNCPTVTQLQDAGLPPDNYPGSNTNPPLAPDSDRDGIGDACDPDPAAPNGNFRAVCLKFVLNVGGVAGPVVGAPDPAPGLDCAAAEVPPPPVPAPPIDIDVSIDDTGSVVPRDGVARVHGVLECDQPALVELEVQVAQRAGRAFIVGVAGATVWCDGQEEWNAEAVGNGRFVGGWVNVSVHAEAQARMSFGFDEQWARVRLAGGRAADH